jgi:hypothetical protein|tara:strand:- start:213 stop:356 length:144 start_codon:yes stop_codon:yes gene_type:complete
MFESFCDSSLIERQQKGKEERTFLNPGLLKRNPLYGFKTYETPGRFF